MAEALVTAFVRRARDHRGAPAIVTNDDGRIETATWADVAVRAGAWVHAIDRSMPRDAVLAFQSTTALESWSAMIGAFASGRGFLPLPARVTDQERAALSVAAPNLHFMSEPSADERSAALDPSRAAGAILRLRTSGSTGLPRLVERRAIAIDRVALTLASTLDVRDGDCVVSLLPRHHSYGVEHSMLWPILAGLTIVSSANFSPAVLHDLFALAGQRCAWPTTPAMLDAMASLPPPTSPRIIYVAGACAADTIIERFIASWGVVPGNLYGASETGTIAFARDARDGLVPVDGVSVRIAEPVPGEICVKSDAMLSDYVPHDDATFSDGYFRTGDIGRMSSGRLRIEGRLKLQFDVGGLKVNPIEIELHLLAHESVREAVVIPMRFSASVLRAHAIVVPKSADIDIEALRDHLRERLPAHMVPRTFESRAALPKTATGKIDRRALSDEP